jgi:hypothetical protein
MHRWLQRLYSGHKRQDFTERPPSDAPAASTKENWRASGHQTSFSFSKGLKSALPIKTREYQIMTNTSAAMILSFMFFLSTQAASFLAHNVPRTLSFLAISYSSLHGGRACEK